MLKVNIHLVGGTDNSDAEYVTIEAFCKYLIQDNRLFSQKIEALDNIIEISEYDLNSNLGKWVDRIHEAQKSNSIPQIQSQLRVYFEEYFNVAAPNNKPKHMFIYGTDDTPVPELLVRNPLLIDEICDQIQCLIKKTYLFKMQILEPLSTFELDNSHKTEDSAKSRIVRTERVQWHGSTVDFMLLFEYLEKNGLIDIQKRPLISSIFLDKKGNPMKPEWSNNLQTTPHIPKPETKHLIEKMAKNRDRDDF
jgi:hypothetical protein